MQVHNTMSITFTGLMALCLRSTYGVRAATIPAQSKRSLELQETDPRTGEPKPDSQQLWHSKKSRMVRVLHDLIILIILTDMNTSRAISRLEVSVNSIRLGELPTDFAHGAGRQRNSVSPP